MLPPSIVAVDVETTGLRSSDRIVSLGAWRVNTSDLAGEKIAPECIHLIFDPGTRSHPRAEEVHGYSDWTLSHQEPFSIHAALVHDFLSTADLVIAHNANFDLEFIDREYRLLGQSGPKLRSYCTMNGFRQSALPGSASLNAICQNLGLRRIGNKHGALEDAWLSLMIYLWLQKADSRHIRQFPEASGKNAFLPSNLREPASLPDGPSPPRRSKSVKSPELKVPRQQKHAARAALVKTVRPVAVLLMEIARADSLVPAEEIEVFADLIHTTRDQLGLRIDDEMEREILAEIFDIKSTQNILTRSARAVCADTTLRNAFPRWLAKIAMADGMLSPLERAAVDRVKAVFERVLSSA
jgi:DNA polymerase III epsilon subunit-like protein